MGNLLAICVHAANTHDTISGINPAKKAFAKYPAIEKFCGDEGYRKTFIANVKTKLGLDVDISPKILPQHGVIPTCNLSNSNKLVFLPQCVVSSSSRAFGHASSSLPSLVTKTLRFLLLFRLQIGINPKRWIVERTFTWVNHSRRLSKDYEISTVHEENMFMISHMHTLLRRY